MSSFIVADYAEALHCSSTTMQRLLALCAAATALYVTPAPRLRRTTVKGDNDDVTEADVRKWMESADVDELLKGGIDLEEIEERELPEMKVDKKEYDASPYVGDFDGTDDELEAPWRTEAAQICREAIAAIGLECADVFWEPGVLRLTVKKSNGEAPDAEETADASRAVVNALEPRDDDLRVLARHGVEVTSPGASDLITTQAAFEAFKGFDVTVRTLNPIEGGEERVIEGRLQERTTTDVVINVKGRMVKIPWHLVGEVRLPPAKSE